MRNGKYSLPKRLTAILLSIVMVLSVIPIAGANAAAINRMADVSTMDTWKSFFDPENITTEHAGGVWTDKSVFTDASAFEGTGITLTGDNFLVALSALAANSIVVGQSSTPTDTMFVLDISGSMESSEINAMVTAANDAIRTLLAANEQSRVGVVLYSTDAHILLELDRYTGVADNSGVVQYIRRRNQNISTVSGLTTESGTAVSVSVQLEGGTYIQGGLWKAWEEFSAVTDAQSTVRTPVLVLMSDGAPTFVTDDYADVPDGYEYGHGSNSYDGDGFVTQLTAAYVKEQMAQKYGTTPYFYTLGLDVEHEVAVAVLDTSADKQTTGINSYWNTFSGLSANGTMNVTLGQRYGGSSTTTQSITYNSAVDGKREYVNKYFAASDASDLVATFQTIVNEISLQSGYYPTRLDDNAPNYGGYITFVDEIGMGMEVKDVKGILIGNHLFSGAALAAALEDGSFGTREEPTALGDNMVWALKERLGIADAETARDLLGYAYTAGQLSYTSDSVFSNYIGWYGDADGNYLGFWQESHTQDDMPADAVYINKCYGMLGSTTDSQTTHASDMMYIAIQVATEIATGNQIVTFRIPAALLPVVTYEITLNDSDDPDTARDITLEYKEADPIRLVYEVGVRSDITSWNIAEILPEGYQTNDDGTYTLFTNHWYSKETANPGSTTEPSDDDLLNAGNNSFTYSYFVASEENEHYYFTEDTLVRDADGNTVTAITEGQTYYYKHRVYTADASGKATMTTHLGEVSAEALAEAEKYTAEGQPLTIPKGTMRHVTHSHDLAKSNDALTGTYSMVRNQIVDAVIGEDTAHHYELTYLGNNGKLTYTPAQGIKLTKVMEDGTTPDVTFTFNVTLSGTVTAENFTLVIREADGTENVSTIPADNSLNIGLKPGQTAFLVGLPVGHYTVTEAEDAVYQPVGSSSASGVILPNQLSSVSFTNEPIVYSSLSVAKGVTYHKGVTSGTANFPVTVTFTKNGAPWAGKTVSVGGVDKTTDAEGKISFTIQDNVVVQITNIPVGIAYHVAEGTLPAGYTWENSGDASLSGTIIQTGNVAVLQNSYTPKDLVDPDDLTLNIKKTLKNISNEPIDWEEGMSFTFVLSRFDETAQDWVKITGRTVTMTYEAYVSSGSEGVLIAEMDLSGAAFDHAGDYLYRVSEEMGSVTGMTYDVTDHDFRVWVSDDHANGQLYISSVEVIDAGTSLTKTDSGWTVEADFDNTYAQGSTKLGFAVNKILTGREMLDGEFEFTLHAVDAEGKETLLDTVKNGKLGDVVFHTQTYTQKGTYNYIVREKKGTSGGVTYDDKEYRISVTVDVEDASEGLKVTDIQVDGTSVGSTAEALTGAITFRNTYEAKETTLELSGTKVLTYLNTGAQITPEDGIFEFTLVGVIGNQVINQTVGNTGSTFRFDTLTFTETGTYRFSVTEQTGSVNGVTYDGRIYDLVVTVTDDGQGQLTASYTSEGVANGPLIFRNTYKAEQKTPLVISGTKLLTGRDITDGEFRFTISGEGISQTVPNVGNGFSFSGLVYSQAGTYTYTVTEEAGTLGGVTYDNTSYTVEVTVTDNGEGELVADYTVKGADALVFENSYDASDATLVLSGHKFLTGRDLAAGEFTFQLEGKDNAPVPAQTQVTNDADGIFRFPTITYTQEGTYVYEISEVAGNLGGVTYDPVVYTVTVTVTDNGSGALVATPDINGSDLQFFNKYTAEDVTLTLEGNKTLTNGDTGEKMDLSGYDFQFQLIGADGKIIETVTQDASGRFSFRELTFSAVGEFKYTIAEVKGNADGVSYDSKVYEVVITVTDNGAGELKLEWTLSGQNDQSILFANTYDPEDPSDPTDPTDPSDPSDPTEPSEPSDPTDPSDPSDPTEPSEPSDPTDPSDPSDPAEPSDPSDPTDPSQPIDPDASPDTGDETVLRWALMMGVSAVCLLAVLVLGKEKLKIQ